ncbi:MAG: amidohydrolase family protein, partial [Acidimicrobiales bacterium]
ATVGPRIVASGPPITVTKGHLWYFGGEADGVEGIRAAVREHVARGVDVVKLVATGGTMTPTVGPHESQYSRDEIRAAVEEAHALGRPVAVHAHGADGIADSLAAGADSIEHCTFFTADGVAADPSVVAQLAASDAAISMTAAVLPGVDTFKPAMRHRLAAIKETHAALHRSGARIVCSSDSGVTPNKPHDVLPYGVSDFLPAIGMTNAEALTATTALAAEVCGLAEVTGTLTPGKDADILAVPANPLTNLTTLHNPLAVWVRGRQVTT